MNHNYYFFARFQMSNHHKNVNFKVLDTANLSNDLSGILGQFLTPGAYSVRKSGFDSNEGFLLRLIHIILLLIYYRL